ncbi:DM13 domain-containing protein [Lyngbya aestuarii]|uniref:DM13 domain-containing protein n=1 Tax=Lyngbya aestuarii TaxID=118322 RepID=UPI00403DDE13
MMKYHQLVQLGLISACLVAISGRVISAVAAPIFDSNGIQKTVVSAQPTALLSGTFVAAEAPTTGVARVVVEDGQRYLELDAAFSTTDMAPDLHVLLEPNATPPKTYANFGGYVNLGRLEKVKGAQRYPIPDAINLANFKSVVIWCRMANATIGYAKLQEGNPAGSL